MKSKNILLSCTVISLQDTRFVYPCCPFCLSRLTEEANSRNRCPKCGFTCDIQHVDYRFRLSLKVSRETRLFGVTVFGGCLNPFFGITAGGLQRFIESEHFEGPQSLQQLLIKAVEDCFIGKCLVFGFKLSSRDAENCLPGELTNESAQFVACQVIPPHGAFLGITVFAYLQNLMQANAHSDCSPKAGCHCWQNDSPVSSFNHTLPLCHNSYSESSNDGIPHPQAWHSVSDLVLCFSPEETRGCSLPEVSLDDKSKQPLVLQWSNNHVQGSEFYPVKLSQSKHRENKSLSTSYESLFNASFTPVINTPCDRKSNDLSFNQLVSKDCLNASFPEKPLFNQTGFILDDAPLSESLGHFLSIDSQIVNQNILRDPSVPESSVLLENNTIPRCSCHVQSMRSSCSVLTPLCDVTNNDKSLKRKNTMQKNTSRDTNKMNSKRNGSISMLGQITEGLENQTSGYEDVYNCSADLFNQTGMNILEVAESATHDADPKKQDCLADISVSESNISTFHFAPSLQSTPIVGLSAQRTHEQRHKLSKNWSRLLWSKKSVPHTSHIRVLQNSTNNRQSEFSQSLCTDSALESSEISAGSSELKQDVKPKPGDSALPTANNDFSRDLFDL